MNVSAIICTFNRCESLRRTLQSFCALEIPAGFEWELIVVDNNSSDATGQVCESFTGKLPIRRIFEPRQGLSCARNRGVIEARSQLFAFTDDDVEVDARWIVALHEAAQRHPQARFFGGKIVCEWEQTPPRWLADHAETFLGCIMMHYNKGDKEFVATKKDMPFYGANVTFRRSVFDDGLRFREDLGRGNGPVPGEEEFLIQQVMGKGGIGVYVPTAIVHHINPPHRMTEKYIRNWCRGAGIKEVRLAELDRSHLWLGAPRYYWKQLVQSAMTFGLTRWTRPSEVWLQAEIKTAMTWGKISEHRRRMSVTNDTQPVATEANAKAR